MSAVVVLREAPDIPIAETIRNDLLAREWTVTVDSFASRLLEVDHWVNMSRPLVVAFIPQRDDLRKRCLLRLRHLMDADMLPVLVAPEETDLPEWIYDKGVRSVVPSGSTGYDRLFEDIFRALLGPMPTWLDIRVRPTQMLRPTGVSWWSEDVFVADERFEHVVRIGPVDSQVILPGLFEPHHIHLDRRLLCVANKSANEIVTARLVDDMATDVHSISDCRGQLRHPHDVRCHHYLLAVADTDNHRVLISPNTNSFAKVNWHLAQPTTSLRAPCGLHADGSVLWVADTFNHRIVAFDHKGRQLGEHGTYGEGEDQFRYPVGVYAWRDYLFVADEESERLQVFRKYGDNDVRLRIHRMSFGAPWVRQAFGLSVNRENRLAIGDRKQKSVWLIDLDQALEETSSDVQPQ